ncbi:YbjN domain-containing protein [Spirulina sp. CS-785/01]|uniref:YbjN domain-containing protein n=1 Tax=Spirulina sp. CS-785/01 TaxID=3021716 RepID=UPI00232F0315|nr:YbjN domain-containing protein [Spirulina sp. CS-785/01]MDB9315300.1 YbjN domain-containing protein [Spirulina sp. CS-785/01]
MLSQSLQSILNQQGLQFYDIGNNILRIHVNGQAATWSTLVKCIDEYQQLMVYSICPNKAPEPKLSNLQEFLTRANFGLKFGNFELDLEDGEIRFKTSVQFAGEIDPAPMIEECLSLNVVSFDRYLPGILQVMFTDTTPQDAIALIESPQSDAKTESE